MAILGMVSSKSKSSSNRMYEYVCKGWGLPSTEIVAKEGGRMGIGVSWISSSISDWAVSSGGS